MKTILFIHGGKVENETPSQRFKFRLDRAIKYYRENYETEDIIFLVSGRWGRVTDNFLMTEAEVGKQYILRVIPDAQVIKEDISVEVIGNYAFSKPLLAALSPDKVIIYTSKILKKRVERSAEKIFAGEFPYEFQYLQDEMSGNEILLDKEVHALKLFNNLFAGVEDGDDASVRDILLYKTPYYFKGVIDDRDYFNTYWEGGFDHYIAGITVRDNK